MADIAEQEKDITDAPIHYSNAEAWAWVIGYNQAVSDRSEADHGGES